MRRSATPGSDTSRSSTRSDTMRVNACGDRAAEVTAMRTTGCALASALTICGASASSGNSPAIRATASRVSVAAMSRSTSSLNSSVTRLRPKREFDEIARTPDTRPAAPSMRPVISWSTVSGPAPGK